jgi:hypothetical protein
MTISSHEAESYSEENKEMRDRSATSALRPFVLASAAVLRSKLPCDARPQAIVCGAQPHAHFRIVGRYINSDSLGKS